LLMNKQQTCGFLGWTSAEFDKAVAKGFPAKKRTSSRGENWSVDSREAVAWVAEQEAAKVRPRREVEPDPEPAPPPGWETFKAAELVKPHLGIGMITALAIMYALPRLAANVSADQGVGIEQTYKISTGLLLTVWTFCTQKLDYWPKDEDAVTLLDEAFLTVNWPWLAARAGEPAWEPPSYAAGWVRVTPEEHEECIRHGEEREAAYRELERNDAA
jgi:hypothetical protein